MEISKKPVQARKSLDRRSQKKADVADVHRECSENKGRLNGVPLAPQKKALGYGEVDIRICVYQLTPRQYAHV